MRTFYFLRHGETDWNLEGRLQGHTDIPLNATGEAQAVRAAQALMGLGITRLISSPLLRARRTAEVAAEALQLPLTLDETLKERTFGSFEGKITAEIRSAHNLRPEQSISEILPPDAEQWPATKARALEFTERLLATYPADTLLFVSHGAVFRALYEVLGGPRLEAANATPYRFVPPREAEQPWQLETLGPSLGAKPHGFA
jgi:probable phosphoglycerate mutase